jgi:glycosyltransferase involved in cell wall biosynthesis
MKLSILTVTFNTLAKLKDAYFSLCAQTFTQWEWVVQDGGSTDGTQQWLESLTDERVNWVSESDKGIYDALNKAISRAKGEWIGLLHSDDLYPNAEVLKLVLEATPGKDAIYGDLKYVQAANVSKVLRYWKSGVFSSTLLSKGWMPPHPTLFLKKEIYDELGMFNTRFKIAADYDFILRVFSKPNLQVAYLPYVLMLMRQGGKSSKWQNLFQKSYEDFLIIRKNGYYLTLVILLRKIGVKFKQFLK